MKTNTKTRMPALFTHEGARAKRITPEQQLRRSVMACMLWESEFYESGEAIGKRIADLCDKVKFDAAAKIAIEAREKMKLRHVPLWIACALAKGSPGHRLADLIERIVQRPDELAELLALYWKDGRKPIAAQIKKGLALAFRKFEEYELAKYNRDNDIKLRDVLFLCHAKPTNRDQAKLWKRLVEGKLETPDTWETNLSSGEDKRKTFERLIREEKLGALALLRNLRNMLQTGVPERVIRGAIESMRTERVLPFRFIAAAKYAPQLEDALEAAMLRSLDGADILAGKTALLVDCSGSMNQPLSAKSDMRRIDAACGLAILLREVCEEVSVIRFDTSPAVVPARRGFALRDAIGQANGNTNTETAKRLADKQGYDRIIILTDEQSHQALSDPQGIGYVINVASAQNGIGYGAWVHLDGWSEAIVSYLAEFESSLVDDDEDEDE